MGKEVLTFFLHFYEAENTVQDILINFLGESSAFHFHKCKLEFMFAQQS